jgi:hypothetical protein
MDLKQQVVYNTQIYEVYDETGISSGCLVIKLRPVK